MKNIALYVFHVGNLKMANYFSLIILTILFIFSFKNVTRTDLLDRLDRKLNFFKNLKKLRSVIITKRLCQFDRELLEKIFLIDEFLEYYLISCPERIFFQGKVIQKKTKKLKSLFSNEIWVTTKDRKTYKLRYYKKFLREEKLIFQGKKLKKEEYLSLLKKEINSYYYECLYFESLLKNKIIIYPRFIWIFFVKIDELRSDFFRNFLEKTQQIKIINKIRYLIHTTFILVWKNQKD